MKCIQMEAAWFSRSMRLTTAVYCLKEVKSRLTDVCVYQIDTNRKIAEASTGKPECENKCFFIHLLLFSYRPGALPCLPGGNEPAPPEYGRLTSDVLGASYQCHPGWPAPSSVCILTFFCFPFSPPFTNHGMLSGRLLWPSSRGWRRSRCCAFSPRLVWWTSLSVLSFLF